MRYPGSLPAFAASMTLATLTAVTGLAQLFSRGGSAFMGLALLVAAGVVSGAARNGRAAYLHRRYLKNSWRWAQALGPRKR